MAKLRVDKIAAPIVKDEFTGSVFFDGSSDYLSLPVSSDFQFGSDDFTIECWAYALDEGTDDILGIYNTGDNRRTFALRKDQTESVQFLFSSNGSSGTSISSAESIIQLRTWHHYAVVRRNLVYEIYFDGVKVATKSDSTDAIYTNNDDGLRIGSSYNTDFHGYISNARICKGHAVYTGNFTPPTRELPVHTAPPKGVVFPAADNRTVLLACQSSTDATADSSGRHTITANGNATAADANPGLFRKTNITSTITETTGSVYFSGNASAYANNLTISSSGSMIGTGDFTVEFFIYSDSTADRRVFSLGANNADGSFVLMKDSDGIRVNWETSSSTGGSLNVVGSGWHHVAAVRSNNNLKIYIDGELDKDHGTVSVNFNASPLYIGDDPTIASQELTGYISNLRVVQLALYTSQFIPPTRELEVTPETTLLACYDGENIFAEKTGNHIIAAYGARTSSPTPTATDNPIGSTTVTPGLTREVDPTAGPTFQGGAGFTSQNWLTLPKGTTTQRNRGRGIFMGGYTTSPSNSAVGDIHYINIPSMGNSFDFGDLINAARWAGGSCGSSTKGLYGGGAVPSSTDHIDYVTIATTGDAVDFGNLDTAQGYVKACSNQTRGIWGGGRSNNSPVVSSNVIQYVTITTLGTAQEFGFLTSARTATANLASPTRGIFSGGYTSPSGTSVDVMDSVTIATTASAVDFGDLYLAVKYSDAASSGTRGVIGGGNPVTSQIQYVTISSRGNALDFGALTSSLEHVSCTDNSIRGVFGGGAYVNTMQYITIATTGNAQDFGDLSRGNLGYAGGTSDSHGGIS